MHMRIYTYISIHYLHFLTISGTFHWTLHASIRTLLTQPTCALLSWFWAQPRGPTWIHAHLGGLLGPSSLGPTGTLGSWPTQTLAHVDLVPLGPPPLGPGSPGSGCARIRSSLGQLTFVLGHGEGNGLSHTGLCWGVRRGHARSRALGQRGVGKRTMRLQSF